MIRRRRFYKWLKNMYKLDDKNSDHKLIEIKNVDLCSIIDLTNYTINVKKETEIKSCLSHVILSSIQTMINIKLHELYPNLKKKKNKNIKQYIKNNNHNIISEISLLNNINNPTYGKILNKLYRNDFTIQNNNGLHTYKINNYYKINNSGISKNINKKNIITTMKYVLHNNIPIIGGFRVPLNIHKSERSGIINHKDKFNFNYGVLFVGYYDNFNGSNGSNKGYFKFQNSWGNRWGDKGFGYLSYKAIINNKCLDLWIINNITIKGNININIEKNIDNSIVN